MTGIDLPLTSKRGNDYMDMQKRRMLVAGIVLAVVLGEVIFLQTYYRLSQSYVLQ